MVREGPEAFRAWLQERHDEFQRRLAQMPVGADARYRLRAELAELSAIIAAFDAMVLASDGDPLPPT